MARKNRVTTTPVNRLDASTVSELQVCRCVGKSLDEQIYINVLKLKMKLTPTLVNFISLSMARAAAKALFLRAVKVMITISREVTTTVTLASRTGWCFYPLMTNTDMMMVTRVMNRMVVDTSRARRVALMFTVLKTPGLQAIAVPTLATRTKKFRLTMNIAVCRQGPCSTLWKVLLSLAATVV